MPHPPCLKERLRTGETVVGPFLFELNHPAVVRIMANAGFDFVILDCEHGQYGPESLSLLCSAARAAGIAPLVRVPEVSRTHVLGALEAGARGIMIPGVRTVDDVRRLYTLAKYAPEGERGITFGTAHTDYRPVDMKAYMRQANAELLLIAQVETREALANLDALLGSGQVDAVLVGPYDLSVALGIPGELEAPALEESILRTLERCRHHGVTPGIFASDVDTANRWSAHGFTLLACSNDLGMLTHRATQIAQGVRRVTSAGGAA